MRNIIKFFGKIAVLFFAVFLLGFLSFRLVTAQGSGGGNQADINALCENLRTRPDGTQDPGAVQQCKNLITNISANGLTCTVAQNNLTTFAQKYYADSTKINAFVQKALALSQCQGGSGSGSGSGGAGSGGGTGGSGDCGNANLEFVNGLCLPKSSGSGLAGATDWPSLANSIINILLTVSGTVAVLFILYGGFLYITAAGNEEQSEKGRKALINAIIGLVVVILSYVIVNVLVNLITK